MSEGLRPSRVKQLAWWLALLLAAGLPALVDGIVRGFGGHVAESMDYSDYRDGLSLAFVISAVMVLLLLQRPSRCLGLRFSFGFLLTVAWLAAALLPRPTCTERLYLGKQGVAAPQREEASEGPIDCGR